MKKTVAFGLVTALAAGLVLMKTISLVQASAHTIRISCTNLDTPILTVEPGPQTAGYYTNYYDTNCVGNGIAQMTACIGPTIRLEWDLQPGVVYIQWSTDLLSWTDIRVANVGVTSRWIAPFGERRFFRYRVEP